MENKVYPGIKNAIMLCLLLLGIQLGAGLIFGFLFVLFRPENEAMINGVGLILVSLLSFGLVILIGYKKSHKSFNEVFMFNTVPLNLWSALIVFMFGFVIVSSELDNLLNYVLPMPELLQDAFDLLLTNEYIILSIILIGIIPAFLEEMLFRGVILSGFRENYSPKKAIIVSAVLFGIVHLNPWQFVTAFIVGIISAWICLKTKSILPAIYIHLFNNMLAVFLAKYGEKIPIRGFTTEVYERTFQPLWFDAIGIILTGIGVVLIIKSMKKADNVSTA